MALSRPWPHGSRRAASGAPHHEGLRFRCKTRPHPEEPAKGGRLEGWAARKPPTKFSFNRDGPAACGERRKGDGAYGLLTRRQAAAVSGRGLTTYSRKTLSLASTSLSDTSEVQGSARCWSTRLASVSLSCEPLMTW